MERPSEFHLPTVIWQIIQSIPVTILGALGYDFADMVEQAQETAKATSPDGKRNVTSPHCLRRRSTHSDVDAAAHTAVHAPRFCTFDTPNGEGSELGACKNAASPPDYVELDPGSIKCFLANT